MWVDAFVPSPIMICGITEGGCCAQARNAVHAKPWLDVRDLDAWIERKKKVCPVWRVFFSARRGTIRCRSPNL